ncbi:ferritin [Tenacibaculum holothuriorum]|uniref:Ferritin n=1 Tax=Tenacibaculum holothuriorum TaxID=1635173 RepID=A0A1Y2P943_9FLAO|nr:ferritin [Tenacibaculum holothuriorum]OSY86963.1 ferritin [Tenacibaculum holothuriorum]
METAIRRDMILDVEVVDLLNHQIMMEQKASSKYLAMASWCDQRELRNSATYFYNQAEEERTHMMKIFKFVNDNGGSALSPTVAEVPHEYESLRAVFEASLDAEIEVTKAIHNVFKTARKTSDFTSEIFLQWFVTEQAEEEEKVRDILDMIDLMDDMPLKMIDERIPTE